jgi:hypothetical protein
VNIECREQREMGAGRRGQAEEKGAKGAKEKGAKEKGTKEKGTKEGGVHCTYARRGACTVHTRRGACTVHTLWPLNLWLSTYRSVTMPDKYSSARGWFSNSFVSWSAFARVSL